MDLARAGLIHDLKHNMGVNDEGLDVILHLIDQMHGLRRALAEALASMRERGTSAPGRPALVTPRPTAFPGTGKKQGISGIPVDSEESRHEKPSD